MDQQISEENQQVPPPIPVGNSKKAIVIATTVVVVIALAGTAYFVFARHESSVPASSPDTQAPQMATYAIAQSTNQPYRCTFDIPGFWGETSDATADVLGKEYVLTESLGKLSEKLHSDRMTARKDGWVYSWGKDKNSEYWKMNIPKYEREASRISGRTIAFEGIGLFFEAPPSDAPCTRIDSVSIVIPTYQYKDMTEEILQEIVRSFNQQQSDASKLPFTIFVPSHEGYDIVKDMTVSEGGVGDPAFFSITLNLISAEETIAIHEYPENQGYNPPAKCQVSLCNYVATTPKGHNIYGEPNDVNGKFFVEYYTKINTTVISLHSIQREGDSFTRPSFTTDMKTLERLYSIVDSFEQITAEELSKIPDGTTIY